MAKEWEALWADLAGQDAARAHRAVARLSAAPGVSAGALQKRLRPAPEAETARVAELLKELDADEFAVREEASRRLRELGEAARGALGRERGRAGLSLEVRSRLDSLLRQIGAPPSSDRLRDLRAVEVLERIGTAEARRVLEALAGGAAGARLTQEAKGTLQRLRQRPTTRP
jgi:hypothetical protein